MRQHGLADQCLSVELASLLAQAHTCVPALYMPGLCRWDGVVVSKLLIALYGFDIHVKHVVHAAAAAGRLRCC